MDIKTKYSIGDTVYICRKDMLRKCKVVWINCEANKNLTIQESYEVEDVDDKSTFRTSVWQMYGTVDDLVKSFNL